MYRTASIMLKVLPPEEALELVLSKLCKSSAGDEQVTLDDAAGRILACDIVCNEDSPAFDRSTVDGYAVFSGDTFGCSASLPAMLQLTGSVMMGENEKRKISHGECMAVPTGGCLPENADCAVMLEHTEDSGDGLVLAFKPCAPYENVIRRGEDLKRGQVLLSVGNEIRARDIGALSSLGIATVSVKKPLRVGVISTGDELIPAGCTPTGTKIRDINTSLLACAVRSVHCEAVTYPIVPDDRAKLTKSVTLALSQCDVLLVSGGSSVGERDALCEVLASLGELVFHGLAMKPGKPTAFAVCSGKPVFGLPGHPLAAFFVFEMLVKPSLYSMLGAAVPTKQLCAFASEKIPSNNGRCEVVSVRLEIRDGQNIAVPLRSKSGTVSALTKTDGYIVIGRNSEGINAGECVRVTLF